MQVDALYAAGRIGEAWAASNTAKRLNIFGFLIGTFLNVGLIVAIIVFVTVGSSSDDDNYDYDY